MSRASRGTETENGRFAVSIAADAPKAPTAFIRRSSLQRLFDGDAPQILVIDITGHATLALKSGVPCFAFVYRVGILI